MIAHREGKKSQARIGDIREILKVLTTLQAEALFEPLGEDQWPMRTLADDTQKKLDKLFAKKAKATKKAGNG